MSLLTNMPYKENYILKDDLTFQMRKQRITVTKYFCDSDVHDRYYLRANTKNHDGKTLNQGYLYFYLNPEKRQSNFIGVSVSEEYRNCGMASLLIANWIELCLDDGILNLETIPKQRKSFVLYLLKKYAFELNDLNTYQTSTRVVHICRKENDNGKYIMFENKQEEKRFQSSNIMRSDNYSIVTREDDIQVLDSVVLGSPYFLQDSEKAYQKSLQVYHKHK